MNIIIPKKFSEKQIDSFINDFYKDFLKKSNKKYFFDFSETEWISNQNLLLITAIIKYLYEKNILFQIKLYNDRPDLINRKQAYQVYQIWEIWKLYQIFYRKDFDKYIVNFNHRTIDFLKDKYNINPNYNLFDRFGITPFVTFDKIIGYKEKNLLDFQIEHVFELNEVIKDELILSKCNHPFTKKTLSYIITKELYENFLDHSGKSFIGIEKNFAFMSISLKKAISDDVLFIFESQLDKIQRSNNFSFTKVQHVTIENKKDEFSSLIKINEKDLFQLIIDADFISEKKSKEERCKQVINEIHQFNKLNKQKILSTSFIDEEIEQTKSFFYSQGVYKNQNLIQYSFLDFGEGISKTLIDEYLRDNKIEIKDLFDEIDDNEIVKYAFKHFSSRHPILNKIEEVEHYIPRGLFDLIVMVQRYKGLLIVRSNKAKVLYDFSTAKTIDDAFSIFGSKNDFFPGTLISIYIPALEKEDKFDETVIKPEFYDFKKGIKPKNINIFNILQSYDNVKSNIYSNLIIDIKRQLINEESYTRLNYISFFGVDDRNAIKKSLLFLLSDYEINKNNSVIVTFPPTKDIIYEVNNLVLNLNQVEKNYKIHPIPLIYYDKDEINLEWLGIFNDDDKKKLDNILFEDFSLAISDFEDGYNIVGNIIYKDFYGNVFSTMPKYSTLIKYYQEYEKRFDNKFKIEKDPKLSYEISLELINQHIKTAQNGLFLCNGNYYQNEFLQLTDLLNKNEEIDNYSKMLFEKIAKNVESNSNVKYIAVTASSHKIIESFVRQGLIGRKKPKESNDLNDFILFDNYLDFENEKKVNSIKDNTNYVLICDAIATGNLTIRIDDLINTKCNSKLLVIGVFVNTIDDSFEKDSIESFYERFGNRLVTMGKYPIKKYRKKDLNAEQLLNITKNLVRISPFTNLPIEFEEELTSKKSVLVDNNQFLEFIDSKDIDVYFKLFNNIIHPYYFNIGNILEKENENIYKKNDNSLIFAIFNKFKEEIKFNKEEDKYIIFYPKNSDISYVNFKLLITNVFQSNTIDYYQLERYNTDSGWKFPHTTDFFRDVIKEKNKVIILDDGSCSGDSLYQMINEIAYFNPDVINLLCIIGRVDDHKREFFSKISKLKKNNDDDLIDVNIFFGTHWHIPTFYKDSNPYSDEMIWIDSVFNFPNTPQKIKRIAKKIKEEIEPTSKKRDNYNYFPKIRFSIEKPIKEILLTRNEIGKIINYRLYKNSFDFFNKIIGDFYIDDSFKDKEKNKKIELLSMCFLYEPYLYQRLIVYMPDIKEVFERFVEELVLNKSIDIDSDLYYNWNDERNNIVFLFFIIYKNEKLANKFNKRNFQLLLNSLDPKKSNYLMYKLLEYSPLNYQFKNREFYEDYLIIISSYLQENKNSDLKLFRFFLSSLPTFGTFKSALSSINEKYRMINDAKKHKEAILIHIEIVLIELQILSNKYDENRINPLLESLNKIIEVIEEILSFTAKYPQFLFIYYSYFESDNIYSLRTIHKSLTLQVSYFNKNSKFDDLINLVNIFRDKFLTLKSIPYRIFNNITTENIETIISEHFDKSKIKSHYLFKSKTDSSIFFPNLFFAEIVLNHIVLNLETYSNLSNNDSVEIDIKVNDAKKELKLEIFNIPNNQTNNGGAIGIHQLQKLNEMPDNLFHYEYDEKYSYKNRIYFYQKIKFKLL